MAGFLDKKKRLIDYKLTELGREKMSLGNLDFSYYTFSDRSISYSKRLDQDNSFNISDSLDSSNANFIPLETTSNEGIRLNPEISLNEILSYENLSSTRFYDTIVSTKKTLSEKIESSLLIDNLTIQNKIERDFVFFSSKDVKSEYDFKSFNFLSQYPTIKFPIENIANIPTIKNDKRFKDFLKNKKLVPVNLNNDPVDVIEEESNDLDLLFKNLEIENLNLEGVEEREKVITTIIEALEDDEEIYKLKYSISEDFVKDSDNFLFELHSVKENNLEKLAFVKIGSFISDKNQKQYTIYIIGKIVKSIKKSRNFNNENRVLTQGISQDYSFINLFTLVIE
jgi:hypothetical protein